MDLYLTPGHTYEESIAHFYRALELDPDYTDARLWSARFHFLIGIEDNTHMAIADSIARILEDNRARMSELDLTMLDLIQAGVVRDWEGIYQAARRGAALAPGTFWTFEAAQMARYAGHPLAALEYFEQIDPEGPIFAYGKSANFYWHQIIYTYRMLGDWPNLLNAIAEYRANSENPRIYRSFECFALGAEGDLDVILALAAQDSTAGYNPTTALGNGYEGLNWGRHDEEVARLLPIWRRFLEAALPERRDSASYRNQRAWVLHLLGDSGAGRRIYAGLIEEYPDNRSYRRNDAFIAAAQGDAQAGRDFIRWMERPDSPYSAEAVIRERALQEAALGNLDEAMRLLRQVVEPGTEPSTLRTAAYEWFWDHPGFQELMRPRG